MILRLLTCAIVAMVCAVDPPSAGARRGDVLPGRYTGTLELTLMGEPQPPEQDDQCLTAADVARFDRWLAGLMGAACSAGNRAEHDGTITFDVTCEGEDVPMTTRGTLTTTGNAFVAVLESRDDIGVGVDSVITLEAERVGDCGDR